MPERFISELLPLKSNWLQFLLLRLSSGGRASRRSLVTEILLQRATVVRLQYCREREWSCLCPALSLMVAGFVLFHFFFVGLAFTQLWLVKERGMDAAAIASRIGMLQLVFGAAGSVVGGVLGDRMARRLPGGHATVTALFVAVCAVPMIAYRFAAPGTWVFYTGMCAGFFLPMALYGAGNAGIVNLTPPRMRSTLASFNMLCINVFALSIGNVVAGRAVDVMAAHGVALPLTHVVLASDILGIASVVFFALAAVAVVRRRGSASPVPVGA